jgi:hypothetical protein
LFSLDVFLAARETMPLDSIEDYERLSEHLTAIDVPLGAFAASHGYTIEHHGRYPNRRLTQRGPLVRSIHITMDVDESGKRFDRFFSDIPYIVWGGAWIDDHVAHIRISSPHVETWQVPFSSLVRTLPMHLDHFHSYLSAITEDYIRGCGTRSPLSDVPPENI